MSKTSKALRAFGKLILIGVITTVVFLCLAMKNSVYWNVILLSFGAVSMVGVCFQIYFKEAIFKEKRSEVPLAFKAIW